MIEDHFVGAGNMVATGSRPVSSNGTGNWNKPLMRPISVV
jgi:hypothetical protein